jgi:DNA-binding transcriptional ArsR family regulator
MEPFGHLTTSPTLDAVFGALADPTRRAILSRLATGAASVQEVAEPFAMSQSAVSKHLKVLEQAGLIERNIDRQKRPARLKAAPMAAAVDWLNMFQKFWSSSFAQLDGLLEDLKKAEAQGNKHG